MRLDSLTPLVTVRLEIKDAPPKRARVSVGRTILAMVIVAERSAIASLKFRVKQREPKF